MFGPRKIWQPWVTGRKSQQKKIAAFFISFAMTTNAGSISAFDENVT
jgi:hypothetical protein